MLLTTKQTAYLGLLVAISVILVSLAGIIETNTLFFLSAASFCAGLAVREGNLKMGVEFSMASILLSFILAPNKIYCVTYSFLIIYLMGTEFMFEYIAKKDAIHKKQQTFWLLKVLYFNCMYVPIVLFFPTLIMSMQTKEHAPLITLLALLFGQVFLVIYDIAYHYFQKNVKFTLKNK
jgi:hypothetical protein